MTPPDRRSMRVLLLEDNPGDARLVREYLREAPGRSVQLQYAESLAVAWPHDQPVADGPG